MENFFVLILAICGYKANMYLRRTLLGEERIFYTNAGYFYLSQLFLGAFLGIITIPVAIIVWLCRQV